MRREALGGILMGLLCNIQRKYHNKGFAKQAEMFSQFSNLYFVPKGGGLSQHLRGGCPYRLLLFNPSKDEPRETSLAFSCTRLRRIPGVVRVPVRSHPLALIAYACPPCPGSVNLHPSLAWPAWVRPGSPSMGPCQGLKSSHPHTERTL